MRATLIMLFGLLVFAGALLTPGTNLDGGDKEPPKKKTAEEIEKLVKDLG